MSETTSNYKAVITAKQGTLLRGGVRQVTTEQSSYKLAVDWVRAMRDEQAEYIGRVQVFRDGQPYAESQHNTP